MNEKRLLKLANFLEQLPSERFNINLVASVDITQEEELKESQVEKHCIKQLKNMSCQTVACAMGWLPKVFPDSFKWKYACFYSGDIRLGIYCILDKNKWNFDAVQIWFDIDAYNANYLFNPVFYRNVQKVTPKTVAEHIRKLVAGEVDEETVNKEWE